MRIRRCELCGSVIGGDDDFQEGFDDPNLCNLCQEVAAR